MLRRVMRRLIGWGGGGRTEGIGEVVRGLLMVKWDMTLGMIMILYWYVLSLDKGGDLMVDRWGHL